eukprot:6482237-Amphidinium_carterae.4
MSSITYVLLPYHVVQEAIDSGEVEVRQEGNVRKYFFVEHISGNEEGVEKKKIAERLSGEPINVKRERERVVSIDIAGSRAG